MNENQLKPIYDGRGVGLQFGSNNTNCYVATKDPTAPFFNSPLHPNNVNAGCNIGSQSFSASSQSNGFGAAYGSNGNNLFFNKTNDTYSGGYSTGNHSFNAQASTNYDGRGNFLGGVNYGFRF